MSLKAPKNSPSNRVKQPAIEPGVYPARLVRVIDAGLQPQRPFEGVEKPPAHMIFLTYELLDVFVVDENGVEQEDLPRWLSEQIPLRPLSSDLAKSTKRMNIFDPDGSLEGDFSLALNAPVMLTVTVGKDDKNYVGGVAAMRPKDVEKAPALKNEAAYFSLSEPNIEFFKSLPQWQQDYIIANLNFKGSPLDIALNGGGDVPVAEAPEKSEEDAPADEGSEDDSNDTPW